MGWTIKGWMSGGYMAAREDGETVFIYRRPDWGSGLSGLKAFFELRSRGELVGRISAGEGAGQRLRAEWLAAPDRPVNEADLLEIAAALEF